MQKTLFLIVVFVGAVVPIANVVEEFLIANHINGYKELDGEACIHSMTEKMGAPSQFNGIWSTIANKGPVFMLLSGSN